MSSAHPQSATAPLRWSSDHAALRPWLRRLATFAAACAVVTAVALRTVDLGQLPGLNGDEAWYGAWAVDFLAGNEVPWRTPTGNLVNLLFLGPQVLLHAVAPRGVTLLRSVAVASGLLAVALNYFLARRTLGQQAAWLSTLMLMSLPINVVYSRFAWDACQTVLAVVLLMHLSLGAHQAQRRVACWWAAVGLALLAACWVHPTNVFTAPVPLAAAAVRYKSQIGHFLRTKQRFFGVVAGLLAILFGACFASASLSQVAAKAASRSVVPAQYSLFGRNVLRLFSGLSVYRYVAGARLPDNAQLANTLGDWHWTDAAAASAALALFIAWRQTKSHKSPADPTLAILTLGGAGTVAGFFLVAGPESIEPHYERYGLCLVAPVVLWSSLVLSRWVELRGRESLVGALTLTVCLALQLDTYQNYLQHLNTTGGQSHATFLCGPVEPKLAALENAMADATLEHPVLLVTSQWWNYWPARYLACGRPGVAVHDFRLPPPLSAGQAGSLSDGARPVFVEFTADPARQRVCQDLLAAGKSFDEQQFADFAGRPAVSLIRPAATQRGPNNSDAR